MISSSPPWPTALRLSRSQRLLFVDFDDGAKVSIPFSRLRIESPSAETRGHGANRPPPLTGKDNVQIVGAERVGRYAVRLIFDDGHDTGLYTWDYLYTLGQS